MSEKRAVTLNGFVIAFVGAILFSTKAIIVKYAFAHTTINALNLLTVRMVFSLPFFLVAAFVSSTRSINQRMTGKQWFLVIALGIFGYHLSSFFDFAGLQYISAGLERLILFLYPSFVLFLNRIFFKQQLKGIQLVALVLTYAGIGIAYYGEIHIDPDNANFYWGSLLVFLCSLTYAIYITGSGKMIPAIGANKFNAYAMLAATGGIFAQFVLKGDYASFSFGENAWAYGLLLALIATVIPTFMLTDALLRIGSNNVAIISSIGPVSTILQAHWILGEKYHAGQLAGTILVIIGVLLTGWKSRRVTTE